MTDKTKKQPNCEICWGSREVPKPPALGSGFSSGFTTFPDQYIPCYNCKGTEIQPQLSMARKDNYEQT